ncbi:MAG: hypothetical protein Q7T78_17040 [Rhodoferax sp.]|nr:hypothetical protein [Rhodoferax sp.]
MITSTQAKEYLDSALGVGVPGFILDAAVAKVATADLSGYSAHDQILLQCMAVAIIAAAGSPRRVTSQGSPSGASRGFKYNDKDLSALRRALAALDTAGILTALIGPDPAAATLFMVV